MRSVAASTRDLTRSELERRFLRPLPPSPPADARGRTPGSVPSSSTSCGGISGLIVETDGYRFHRGRSAFEADRARDVELKLRGYEVVRFTYRQVVDEAPGVARTLRVLLA